jgi:hypothetical protein
MRYQRLIMTSPKNGAWSFASNVIWRSNLKTPHLWHCRRADDEHFYAFTDDGQHFVQIRASTLKELQRVAQMFSQKLLNMKSIQTHPKGR